MRPKAPAIALLLATAMALGQEAGPAPQVPVFSERVEVRVLDLDVDITDSKGTPVTEESDLFGLGTMATGFIGAGRFSLYNLGDVSALTARQLEDLSITAGIARLQRVEDGARDPRKRHKAVSTLSPPRA